MTQKKPIIVTQEPTIGSRVVVTQEPITCYKILPCHEL
jgi:hypothetical protein